METDVIGTNSVASLIEQSGLNKFIIYRQGNSTRGHTPIFEYLKNGQVKGAVEQFKLWASNVLSGGGSGMNYDIVLFNDIDSVDESEEASKKNRRIKFSFSLSSGSIGVINGTQSPAPYNVSELIQSAVSQALAERDREDMKKEMQAIKEELQRYREEEEEEEPEEEGINGLASNPIITQLLSAIGMNGNKQAPAPAINGESTTEPTQKKLTQEQVNNINRAIKILFQHDDQIDTDLLKLAAISQNNTSQFKFLLNALRNM